MNLIPTLSEAAAIVADIGAHEIIWIAAGSWLIFAGSFGTLVGRSIRKANEPVVNRMMSLPPVPRVSDAEVNRRIPALEALFAEADQS